jgi:cobalt-zinc-cadmium efflux system protein
VNKRQLGERADTMTGHQHGALQHGALQHGADGHAHHVSADADWRWLVAATALIVAFMAGEVVAGLAAHSLALLSDAAHMLTDAAAIVLALVTARVAARPPGGGFTYGMRRLEILSAQANGITLILLAVWLAYGAVRRLVSPEQINGGLMLAVALVGVLVNLAATWMFAQANAASERRSLNLEGAAAHVLTDLYAFAATTLAAIVILAAGFTRADPIATLVVVVLMLQAGSGLVRKSGRIFLEAAPAGLDIAALGSALAARPHVAEVHDLHIWEITTDMPAASAHVLVEPHQDCHAVRADLEELLYRVYGIRHLTLQVDHLAEVRAGGQHDGEHPDPGRHSAGGHGPAQHSVSGHDHEEAGHGDADHGDADHGDADHGGHRDDERDRESREQPAAGPAHCEDAHGPSYRPARDR